MLARQLRAVLPRAWIRHQSSTSGSLFKDLEGSSSAAEKESADAAVYNTNADLLNHPYIKSKMDPQGKTATEELLSPLKQILYSKVLAANNGKFVNNQTVEHEGSSYKLSLTPEQQKALIPSVYIQSYRIKSSWKKMFMFLRMYRQMGLTEAITQSHFSSRRMARDIANMLERGRDDAIKLGMNPETMHIDQIWVGKDGNDFRRIQFKGRGRTGVITHPYVHVKAILKDNQVREDRKALIKKRLDRKLWQPLRNWTIKEDDTQTPDYKW